MNQILCIAEIVVPVFAVIGLGYFFAWTRVFSERAADGLADYVFVVAIPLMIIRTFIEAKLPEASPWGYWIAYFLSVAVVFAAMPSGVNSYLLAERYKSGVVAAASAVSISSAASLFTAAFWLWVLGIGLN